MEAVEIKKIFTENIRKYRNLTGMTQQELAEEADISVGFLCDLESGKKWGTLETMAKISKALRIKPYQLLLPEENKNFDVTLHEDLSELGQFITQAVETKIKLLMKKYSM
ncbi:MAG: helix-turn-helix domain-containing protein [Treponema sp.]|uniref:helix-turn-helix domain-containing protein n=1 Tax=Treponema sp. TaxID=166 RepID=UPI0025D7478E|nr:helix-turn-helix domain-containing protein [Treponema sp.]MBR0099739.1 helix-turn-helix domain-containing protein [Treponema sp.]MBR0496623.1 helix-turn-helix domain-containing protein [Treponema sp.]